MKKALLIIAIAMCACVILSLASVQVINYVEASGGDDPPPPRPQPTQTTDYPPPEAFQEALPAVKVHAEIEHRIDLIDGKTLFVKVRTHPGDGFPGITGGYVATYVNAYIRIRGISVPTACQTPKSREGKPIEEVILERQRCEASINYTWGLLSINKKLILTNPELQADGVVECDVQYQQGGAWHDLATALTADEHARIELIDGEWAWGSRNVKPK